LQHLFSFANSSGNGRHLELEMRGLGVPGISGIQFFVAAVEVRQRLFQSLPDKESWFLI
jgi:hypothetical protein